MKYTLKKKFHPNQVEEIGHVFESIRTICYSIAIDEDREHTYQIPPHEIALLIHAGFLEQQKEKCNHEPGDILYTSMPPQWKCKKCGEMFTAIKLNVKSVAPEQKIELWEEELKQRQGYWLVRDNGYVDSVLWLNDEYDIFRLKTKNCHRTKESAEEALRLLKSKYEIE